MLTKLDLSDQQFDYLPEKVVSNCEKMTEIDLSNNSLKMLQDDSFYNLTALLKLNLSDNQLRNLKLNLSKNCFYSIFILKF